MATLPERIPEEHTEAFYEEALEVEKRCLSFLCFRFGLRKGGGAARRSLLHGNYTRENWWEKRGKRAKELLESMGVLKWRALIQRLRCRNITRRKPVFHYDPMSYALNFDEGGDHEIEGSGLINFSEPIAARTG